MASSLAPAAVASRLDALRAAYVPETLAEGERRRVAGAPVSRPTLAETAARGLAELRALCALAAHLHDRR